MELVIVQICFSRHFDQLFHYWYAKHLKKPHIVVTFNQWESRFAAARFWIVTVRSRILGGLVSICGGAVSIFFLQFSLGKVALTDSSLDIETSKFEAIYEKKSILTESKIVLK